MPFWATNLRLGARPLRRAPAFALTTILLLGLGIGSVTTIFTVVDHLVLRELPYPAAGRLVSIENGSHPGPVFREFQETVGSIEMWGATRTREASLLLRSFLRLHSGDPGFRVEGLWTVPLNPTGLDTPGEYIGAMDRVQAALDAVPGVTHAAHGLSLPFQFTGTARCCWSTSTIEVDGERREGARVFLHPVTEGWFETLGLPLVAGRSWTRVDAGRDPWPVVLSEGFAVRLFGSAQGALYRVLTAGGDGSRIQVLGVARDDRHYGLDQGYEDAIYLPMEELPWATDLAGMVVRIGGEAPAGFAGSLREE